MEWESERERAGQKQPIYLWTHLAFMCRKYACNACNILLTNQRKRDTLCVHWYIIFCAMLSVLCSTTLTVADIDSSHCNFRSNRNQKENERGDSEKSRHKRRDSQSFREKKRMHVHLSAEYVITWLFLSFLYELRMCIYMYVWVHNVKKRNTPEK